MVSDRSEGVDLPGVDDPRRPSWSLIGGTRRATLEEVRSMASVHIGRGVSWPSASFLLINGALGAGVLHFPFAYVQAGGIAPATIVQAVLLVLLSSTMVILAWAADIRGDNAYHDVLRTICGVHAQRLAAISVLLACYGTSASFLLIIGDQYDRLFYSLYGSRFCDVFYMRREFTIAVTALLFILPCCFFRKLGFLKYGSAVGVFVMLYPVFLTVVAYFEPHGTFIAKDTAHHSEMHPHSVVAAARVVPTVCFAYQTHEIVVSVYANLRERKLSNMVAATSLCMTVLFVVYTMTAIFGFLTFGSTTRPDIMQNFDANSPVVLVGIAALIVKMVATYPLLAVCGRDVLEGILPSWSCQESKLTIDNGTDHGWSRGARHTATLLWFGTTVLLSTVVSNLTVVIGYMGALACANIFIFPGMCLMAVAKRNDEFRVGRRAVNFLMGLLFTMFGVILVGTVLLGEVFDEDAKPASLLCEPEPWSFSL